MVQCTTSGLPHPEVIGVEDIELLDGLEVVFVLLGHLGHLQQAQLGRRWGEGVLVSIMGSYFSPTFSGSYNNRKTKRVAICMLLLNFSKTFNKFGS